MFNVLKALTQPCRLYICILLDAVCHIYGFGIEQKAFERRLMLLQEKVIR